MAHGISLHIGGEPHYLVCISEKGGASWSPDRSDAHEFPTERDACIALDQLPKGELCGAQTCPLD